MGKAKNTVLFNSNSSLHYEVLRPLFWEREMELVYRSENLRLMEELEKFDLIVSDGSAEPLRALPLRKVLLQKNYTFPVLFIVQGRQEESLFKNFLAENDFLFSLEKYDLSRLPNLALAILKRYEKRKKDLLGFATGSKGDTTTSLSYLYENLLVENLQAVKLRKVYRTIASLRLTVKHIFALLGLVADYSVAVILLKYEMRPLGFAINLKRLHPTEQERLSDLIYYPFAELFPDLRQEDMELSHFHNKQILEEQKRPQGHLSIQSQWHSILKDHVGAPLGILYLAHHSENYFATKISHRLERFVETIDPVLYNSLFLREKILREKKIRTLFSRFVPAEIIDNLIAKEGSEEILKGEKRNVVVLFCDIRSFTNISEQNTAADIVSFLNHYFDKMVEKIGQAGGTIDKFIGDAILAIFGAPKSYEDNALRALQAAEAMIRALQSLEFPMLKLGEEESIRIGIGIHQGDAVVGNIGSREKLDYTVIGDTVNLASRLEGLSKHYRQEIIISETVKKELPELPYIRELEAVRVKGKKMPTRLYAVEVRQKDKLSPEFLSLYRKAISLYKMKNWHTAREYFTKAQALHQDDYLCDYFLQRCERYAANPPDESWDGTVTFDFK